MKNKILALAVISLIICNLGACGVRSSTGAAASQPDVSANTESAVSSEAAGEAAEASSEERGSAPVSEDRVESENSEAPAAESQGESLQNDPSDSEAQSESGTSETSGEEGEQSMVDHVDNAIQELSSSEDYANASDEDKKAMFSELLEGLEKDGYILNVYYDEKSEGFSFRYANGVQGGVSFRDFSQEIDGLVLN